MSTSMAHISPSSQFFDGSPRRAARLTGALWLTCIISGIAAFIVDRRLVVATDAAATARNIVANELLFRVGFSADFISGLSYIGVTALLYYLLEPSGRALSLVAASFGVAGVAVGGIAVLCHLLPTVLLHASGYLHTLTRGQLEDLALLAYRIRLLMFPIGMVFFGIQIGIAGSLIARSAFLPRLLGVLLAIAGVTYITIAFINFLTPAGGRLIPFVMLTAFVAEGSLTAFLLTRGLNEQHWRATAAA